MFGTSQCLGSTQAEVKNQRILLDDSMSLTTQCLCFRSLDCSYSGLLQKKKKMVICLFFLFSSSIINIMSSLVWFDENVDKTHRNSCSRTWEYSKRCRQIDKRRQFPAEHYHPLWPWLSGIDSTWNAGDPGSIPGSGRSPGTGNGNPLQYSCLENSMDWGTWQASPWGYKESGMTEQLTLSSTQLKISTHWTKIQD